MKGYQERLTCSKEVREMILIQCKKEYIKHHPEMIGIHITHNKILYEIAKFYLK